MIAYTIETAPPALRSFAGVRRLLIAPPARLYETAQAMTDTEAFGGLAKLAGVIIQTGIDADRGMEKSHLSDAQKAIDWMGSPRYCLCCHAVGTCVPMFVYQMLGVCRPVPTIIMMWSL